MSALNLPPCPRCGLQLIHGRLRANHSTMLCPKCGWDVDQAKKAGPELLRAVLLFVAQYQGCIERETRPEMFAARIAIEKAMMP